MDRATHANVIKHIVVYWMDTQFKLLRAKKKVKQRVSVFLVNNWRNHRT